jgi:hypothetical protein
MRQESSENRREYQRSAGGRTVLICLGCHGPPLKDAGQAHRDSSWNLVLTVTSEGPLLPKASRWEGEWSPKKNRGKRDHPVIFKLGHYPISMDVECSIFIVYIGFRLSVEDVQVLNTPQPARAIARASWHSRHYPYAAVTRHRHSRRHRFGQDHGHEQDPGVARPGASRRHTT